MQDTRTVLIVEDGTTGLVPGEDPRDTARRRPFSAAPLSAAGGRGYVYVILGGERYETSLRVIRESYLVRITAADTGPGISEEDLPRIFDRFFRPDRSRPRPGAGLGLTNAREIVELHGGTLEVESREGAGARFHFSLSTSPCPDPGQS
jgi:signal transduction histidine kinase